MICRTDLTLSRFNNQAVPFTTWDHGRAPRSTDEKIVLINRSAHVTFESTSWSNVGVDFDAMSLNLPLSKAIRISIKMIILRYTIWVSTKTVALTIPIYGTKACETRAGDSR